MNRMEFFKKLELEGVVLNFGSAQGKLHSVLKSRHSGVVGVDMQKPADLIRDLNKKFDFPARPSMIIAGEVIEHLDSPLAFLKECHRTLRKNGRLIITTPNADSLLSFYAGAVGSYNKEHFFLFNKGSLSLILEKAGFKHHEIFFLDASEDDGNCGKRPLWAMPFQVFTKLMPNLKFHLCAVATK